MQGGTFVQPVRGKIRAEEQPLAGSLPAVISAGRLASTRRSSVWPPDRVGEPQKLTLRELEALARALLSVLLAFLHPGIARQKSVLAQRRAQLWIKSRYRSRQSHAHRASLPAHAAAMRRHYHVHL